MKIMIVEDDPTIRTLVEDKLREWGYEVFSSLDFQKILEDFDRFQPDLLILDLGLPFYNGYYWCREIRKLSNLPILFLSSAAEDLNIIMAMDLGADDYITKPFHQDLLLAKIRALLRRSFEYRQDLQVIRYGDLALHLADQSLRRGDQVQALTKNEFRIMDLLLRSPGEIVSRQALMTSLWQSEEFIDDNTLSVNIARLRQKLKSLGLEDLIQTKVKVGYYVKKI